MVNQVPVRLLGPIEVLVDGAVRPVHGVRRKAVLAGLALHPGTIVSTDKLVEIVWADKAPATAATALQSHVSHLRRALGEQASFIARPPGYLLRLGEQATDVQVAEDLIRRGTEAVDPDDRERLLRAAVELWRDRPLADLAGLPWFDDRARGLEDLLLRARLELIDTRLALGHAVQLIPELEDLGRQHPLNEQIHKLLMLTLYRAGRQADALATYQRLRHTLDEELAIAPSQALQELQTRILRQDSLLDPSPVRTPFPSPAAVPAQLPLVLGAFSGRAWELASLDRMLGVIESEDQVPATPSAVVISAISGTAGIGKSTLAVHWAHRVARRFPDGQLYVNLRGFDAAGPPMDPSEAVRGFLTALGVPSERIPDGLDSQISLYRSLLTGKRVLVVLDNARNAEQVRPLLPGSPGCFAVVTSRNQLVPLVVSEGAHPLVVDLLSSADAQDLLAQRIGSARVAAEPDAVAEIIDRCAGLPLALAITAARAATHPEFPLAALAAQLHETTARLDALHGGDATTNVRVAFACSYQVLSIDAARLYRLLGLHPGPDVGLAAATSLAGCAVPETSHLLAELTGANLLTEHSPGRYCFHDLLRSYASEQARACDGPEDRHAAIHRLLDHYLHTAHAAARILFPKGERVALDAPRPGVHPECVESRNGAVAWFAAERQVLVAAFELAAADGFDTHTWQLASALRTFLIRQAHSPEPITIQRTALLAARRAGDRAGQAHTLHGLGHTYTRSGNLDEAIAHYRQALDLYTGLNDPVGQARIHLGLAWVAEKQGRPADSLNHNRYAYDLYRFAGNEVLCATALNGIGWSHALLGDYTLAIESCSEALDRLRKLGDRDGQAHTWDSLGYAHLGLADYRQSIACYQHAIELCRDLGEHYWEALSLSSLGDAHHASGDQHAALNAWQKALSILDALNHPDAERLRASLRAPTFA